MVDFVLDTDVCIELMRGNNKIIKKISSVAFNQLYITSINLSELVYGSLNHQNPTKAKKDVHKLLQKVKILNTTIRSSIEFGKIKHQLKTKGKMIPDFDILIASMCIAENKPLYSLDGDFKRIAGLGNV